MLAAGQVNALAFLPLEKKLVGKYFNDFFFFVALFSGPVEFPLILNFPMAALSTSPLPSVPDTGKIKFIGSSASQTQNSCNLLYCSLLSFNRLN